MSIPKQPEYLKAVLGLLERFLELTQETALAVEKGDFTAFASLLQARGRVLEEVAKGWNQMVHRFTPGVESPQSAAAGGLLAEVRNCYQKITACDRIIAEKLEKEKGQIRGRISKVQHGHRTLQGYNPQRFRIPRYCDKKG